MMEEQGYSEEVEADDRSGRAGELARAWVSERARKDPEVVEAEAERVAPVIRWVLKAAAAQEGEALAARFDELSQMLVHEMKNPLSQVQIGVEMLSKRTDSLGDDERMYMGWIQRGVARAVQVLEDVRVLGLAEAGQASARWVRIGSVVQGVLARFREEAERAGVLCGVDGDLPDGMVDGAQVGMALGNLVANAIKYSDPSKPERWVRVRVERVTGVIEGWRFTVADNGLGIPPRLQRDVFRRHFRGHPGAAEGMGLGLSIARQVIERREGHIWFHSDERKGTTFHFVIPDRARPPLEAPVTPGEIAPDRLDAAP